MASLVPFVSRQDLTSFLGRDVTEDPGALAAVDAACDICRSVAGQTFNEVTDDKIVLDGAGIDSIVLPEFPVTKVSSVAIEETAEEGFRLDERNGILYRGSSCIWLWPKGRQNVEITYDHGYAEEDLPRDVRMVALTVASRLIVQGVAISEEIGEVKIQYAGESTALMPTERLILEKYRRTR